MNLVRICLLSKLLINSYITNKIDVAAKPLILHLQRKSFGSLSALLQCWFRLASHHRQGWFGSDRTNPVCDVYQMCLNPEVGTRENRKSIERAQILLCYARINGNVKVPMMIIANKIVNFVKSKARIWPDIKFQHFYC